MDCQRARGQHQLLQSNVLPTWLRAVDERVLLELDFELDPVYPDDPLFRAATLPNGWALVPTPHVLWSQIVDADRGPWYQVFYDAAYFQRRALLMPAFFPGSLRPGTPKATRRTQNASLTVLRRVHLPERQRVSGHVWVQHATCLMSQCEPRPR